MNFRFPLVFFGIFFVASCSSLKNNREPGSSGGKTDFLSLCQSVSVTKGFDVGECNVINQKLFSSNQKKLPLVPVKPALFNAPSFDIDSKIQFILFYDPNFLPGVAYCYFVYRKWVQPDSLSPDDMGLMSSGFSILNEDIKGYDQWLSDTPDGKQCRKRIERDSLVPVTDLSASLNNSVALIGLNPLASVNNGLKGIDAVNNDLKLTLNHERIHAYQSLCGDFDLWSQQQWVQLAQGERNKVMAQYPAYNWSDYKVAGREYIAFKYENEPEKILKIVGNCKVN